MIKKRNLINFFLFSFSSLAIANSNEDKITKKLTYSIGISNFNVRSLHNRVLFNDYDAASMLSWKANNIIRLDNDFTFQVSPKTKINFNFWFGLNGGNSILEDYDKIHDPNTLAYFLFNISKNYHKDYNQILDETNLINTFTREVNTTGWNVVSINKAKLTKSRGFDLNLQHNIYNKHNFHINGLLGYKLNNYRWDTENLNQYMFGEYEYHYNKSVIRYNEIYRTPYIGLSFDYKYNSWNVNLIFKYSHWNQYKATDNHILRYLVSNQENLKASNYYNLNLGLAYKIRNNFNIFISYKFEKYPQFKIKEETYKDNKLVSNYEDSKKVFSHLTNKNITTNITVGFKYIF